MVTRRVFLGLLAIAGAVFLAWLPGWIAGPVYSNATPTQVIADAEISAERLAVDTVLISVLIGCALLAPLFANGRRLEPRQFAQLSARPASIATALLVTTPMSWPVLWLLVWFTAYAYFQAGDTGAGELTTWWALLVAALLVLLLLVCGTRVISALSKLIVRGRSIGMLRVTGLLLLIAALPVGVFAVTQMMQDPGGLAAYDATEILGWTPLGAPAAGIALAQTGDTPGALLRFAIVLAAVIALIAVWFPLVRYSVQHTERPVDVTVARDGLGWFERVSAKPGAVIGARALSYWARDPRYRVALAAIPIAPVVMLLALWVAGMEITSLALIPLPVVLLLFGWSLHNDIAMDSTAIWMHVASGTRGRHDRAGRLLPVLIIGLPLVVIGSSITVTVMGDWRVLPAVLGMNLGVLLAACGVASVFSALMPYPATRPGDSPFAQPAIVGSGAGSAQTLSMILTVAFAVPPVWFAAAAISGIEFGTNMLALAFGAAYGLVILLIGVLLGGRIFDRAGPELIAITQTFD